MNKLQEMKLSFYEKVGPDGLREFGRKISMDDCEDIKKLHGIIAESKIILEIGAGYGRVLRYISEKFPNKRLIGLENAKSMLDCLNELKDKIEILDSDAVDFTLSGPKPDLVLWLWSGFADLPKEDQELALSNIFRNTSDDALLIIDLPDIMTSLSRGSDGTVGKIVEDKKMEIIHPVYGAYSAYIGNEEDMGIMITNAGFRSIEITRYDILQSPRIQYRIRKT